jgi:hypothetical protein
MSMTADCRKRVRNSAIGLAVFAFFVYAAFIVYSIRTHGG